MSTLGDTLRGERLRRGLKTEEIASEIKISPYMVEAMETGRFDRLPGGSYRRSFLRQYAHILGVDENEIVAEFRQEYGEAEVPLPKPPASHRSVPIAAIWVAVACLACAGVYKFFPGMRKDLSGVPAASRSAAPAQAAQATFTPPVEVPPPQLSAEPSPPEKADPPVRVVLDANEPVWVSVQCDGLSAFRGLIEPSAGKEFSATHKITVLAGNAGGLTISLNGKQIHPLGARRAVQAVELTPEGARVVPRKRPPVATEDEPGAI